MVVMMVKRRIHEHKSAIGNAIENIDLSAAVFHHIVAEPLCLVLRGFVFRSRLVWVKAIVSHKYHMINLCHLLCYGYCPAIAYAAPRQHDHQFRIFLSKFKVFHLHIPHGSKHPTAAKASELF